ncbi:helix-turn-helix domain-containing protein [Croceicoccus sp. YJ47]|uniref:helix-turn-helix domain-containing protein n=1 Tax=Croceicoccus sp. YJ47 TaxID=2798724 RepID=UPI0019240081|nr:helix-turn-helix transcriptional regulator [Croceicoccus sp. YJ47]QQN75027.1 helix-turn-helix transcriptional regulator [Croceicoccus sp. YJ47]
MARTTRLSREDEMPNRVRDLRKQREMTLVELAEKIGMAHGHLAKIERGHRDLNQQWMERIGAALDVEPADLLHPRDGGLTEEERDLIRTYRAVPAALRAGFDALRESARPYMGTPEVVPLHPDESAEGEGDTIPNGARNAG